MEVGGWNKTRDHHHTFSLSFLPLDLFLCHILFFFLPYSSYRSPGQGW